MLIDLEELRPQRVFSPMAGIWQLHQLRQFLHDQKTSTQSHGAVTFGCLQHIRDKGGEFVAKSKRVKQEPPGIGIREVLCTRWDQLMGELFADSFNQEINRYRSPYVFRGLANYDYKLESSLYRLGHKDPEKIRFIEERLVDSFRKYAHGEFDSAASNWHWISLAQHHGLPTRLLDWTYSPLVALHFATSDVSLMHHDAVVWCVDRWAIQDWLPKDLERSLKDLRTGVFSIELLAKEFPTFDKFDNPDQQRDFMVFFEPPALDGRIVNQGALFSFLSRPDLDLDDWLAQISITNKADRPPLCKKVRVAKELRWEIRDKLDHANLQERVLFPGLDGLCAWLKRWYTPSDSVGG